MAGRIMIRRNISISDELWDAAKRAAADAGAARGKPMPISEWLRLAIEDRLGKKSVQRKRLRV